MGKFGVGVGEDFPVDEGKPKEEGPDAGKERDRPEGDCGDWHDADWHRRWREYAGHSGHWHGPRLWRAVFIIGGIALLIAIISHFFYFILGAAVLAVLYVTHRNHHDAMWDLHPRAGSQSGETS